MPPCAKARGTCATPSLISPVWRMRSMADAASAFAAIRRAQDDSPRKAMHLCCALAVREERNRGEGTAEGAAERTKGKGGRTQIHTRWQWFAMHTLVHASSNAWADRHPASPLGFELRPSRSEGRFLNH